ncbi:MFS transporter, partial [Mycobacterium sp. shizuoka-1]|uniref:MFS transporter n=1 Tax=Mycobacterium sp. shizuoka-1 TaxID=2039281 RepID=UPI0011572043
MAGQGPTSDTPSTFGDEDYSSGGTAVRIASVAALGGLLFGYDSAVINGAVDSIQEDFGIGNAELGFAVASALLGAAAGAMSAGRIADRIGRISVMKIAAVFFFISAIGTGLAPNVELVVLFRIVGGIGVGIASVIAPAYIAETSPPRIRGRLGSLQQLAIVSGIFLSFAINWVLQRMAGGPNKELWIGLDAWRWMFLAMAVPAVLYGALAFTIPESPRYLVASHKIPEARRVLTMLLGEKNLEITISRIQETLEREDKPSWRDLRKPTGGLYGIVWVGLGLSIFQQFVGINVIFYYSNVLWQA